jgi:ferredoxin--NADP+ reductase
MATKALEYNATIVKREDFTAELSTFHVKYDQALAGDPIFVPGQYVALGLNNVRSPQLGSVRRSMSIASAPEQREVLEFYIRYVTRPESDNPLTHSLWPLLVGARVFATRKPVGKFTVPDTLGRGTDRWHIYVAAGTGLAPFVSMVRSSHLRDAAVDLSRVVLLHGASYPADLTYRDELETYCTQHGLKYFGSVSRPREAPDWAGDVGRVEDYFLPERLAELEARIGVSPGFLGPSSAGVLVCGLQGTIARCIERLARRGFVPFDRKIRRALGIDDSAPSHLWWEQYDNTPVIDIGDPKVVSELKRDLAI